MAKLNIKRALNKKTLMIVASISAGYYAGTKISESGVLDKVTEPLGADIAPYAGPLLKIIGSAVIYATMKGDLIKNAALGLGANGGVELISNAGVFGIPGMSSQTSRNWSSNVNGQDMRLNGQDASLNGGYPDQPN